ncbi:hypothetical protein [Haloarchaeobius sp. DFWS5]
MSDRPECRATNVRGDRCGNPAIPALGVCHRHVDQLDEAEEVTA